LEIWKTYCHWLADKERQGGQAGFPLNISKFRKVKRN